MDILHLIWAVLSFVLGLVWQAAWFILRDLISTTALGSHRCLAVLERPLPELLGGTIAMAALRPYGLRLLWRWLRGKPGAPCPPSPRVTRKSC